MSDGPYRSNPKLPEAKSAPRDFLAELEQHVVQDDITDIDDGSLLAIALFRIEAAIQNAGVYSAIGSGIGGLLHHGLTEGLKEVIHTAHKGCIHPLAEHRQKGGCLHDGCYCLEKGGAIL